MKLFPNDSNSKRSTNNLSPIGQRLFMLILFMMFLLENDKCEMNEKKVMDIKDGLFNFKGGREFYDLFGKYIDINNRTNFSRAVNDLIAHGLLKSYGYTQGKMYTAPFGSEAFFKKGIDYLADPIDKRVHNFDTLDNERILETKEFLKSGFTALSRVTMISDESKQTLITDRETFKSKFSDASVYTDDFRNEPKYSIQIQKYNMEFFNVMYRRVDEEYPKDVVDPFNLYLILYKENDDERVTYELEKMLNNIWRN